MPALGQDGPEKKEVQEYVADFDWIAATNGKKDFKQPLLTMNQEDLERFVATGIVIEKKSIGGLSIESREGTYYSTKEDPDDSLDVPASVIIRIGDKVLAGAKGLYFDIDVIDKYVMVEHWNGSPGCSLARWFLEATLTPIGDVEELQVVDSEYRNFETRNKCKPG